MDILPEIISDEEHQDNNEDLLNYEETLEDKIEPEPEIDNKQFKEEDIFKDKPPKIKEVVESSTPKPKKKRKPMSEEHKKKLALARGKALETRRKNASEKKEIKELNKLKKEKELNDLRDSVKPVKKSEPIDIPKPDNLTGEKEMKELDKIEKLYTQKDMEQLTTNAIMNYDKIRKDRKKKKDIKKQQEQHDEVERQNILKQVSADPINQYWDNCY